MSELARRVRERRAALGLSQEELADRMGYRSKSSVSYTHLTLPTIEPV